MIYQIILFLVSYAPNQLTEPGFNLTSSISHRDAANSRERFSPEIEAISNASIFSSRMHISMLLLLSDRLCKDIGWTIRSTRAVPVHRSGASNRGSRYSWTVRGYDHILAMGAHSWPLRGRPSAKIRRDVWHHRQVQRRTGSVDDTEQGDHPPTLRPEHQRYRAALHAARHPLLQYVLFKIDSCAFACALSVYMLRQSHCGGLMTVAD